MKLLGVHFDQSLSWKKHANIVYGQLVSRLTTLRTLSKYASFRVMKTVATGLIIGKLQYSLPLWFGMQQYMQQKFQTILISAAKICLGPKSLRMSTKKLLQPMGWMGFSQLGEFVSIQLVHRIINTGAPSLLHAKINNPLPGNTRASTAGNLRLPAYNKAVAYK